MLDKYLQSKTGTLIALLLPVVFIYLKTLKFGFTTLDDQWLIVRGTSFLGDWNSLCKAFFEPVSEVYYRPIFMCSLIIDFQLGKLSPFIYHLSNILWHCSATVLLYRFLILIGSEKVKAYLSALLFAVHPIMVHAVAWIPGRNDIMLCCFSLLSINALLMFLHSYNRKYLVFLYVFFTMTLLTKESAIVLPLIYLGLMKFYGTKPLRSYVVIFVGLILISILYLLVRSAVTLPLVSVSSSISKDTSNTLLAFFMYVGKAVFPLKLSVMPSIDLMSAVEGTLVVIALIFLFRRSELENKQCILLGFFIFCIFIALPVWYGAVKSGGEHYEHRAYTSMIGFSLMLSKIKWSLSSVKVNWILGIFLLIYTVKTFNRIDVYRSEESFVDAGMKDRPDHYLFFLQKGDQLNGKSNFSAIGFYNRSIELRPDHGVAYANRATAFLKENMFENAIEDYDRAIKLSVYNANNYLNRCYCLARISDAIRAKNDLDTLEKYSPEIIDPKLKKIVNEMFEEYKGKP